MMQLTKKSHFGSKHQAEEVHHLDRQEFLCVCTHTKLSLSQQTTNKQTNLMWCQSRKLLATSPRCSSLEELISPTQQLPRDHQVHALVHLGALCCWTAALIRNWTPQPSQGGGGAGQTVARMKERAGGRRRRRL